MTKLKDIEQLASLSALHYRRAQAAMAEIRYQEAALRRNLAELVAKKRDLADAARLSDDPALKAGADLRWHQWADQRRASINTELARVLALKETRRGQLQQMFGKDQAVNALLSRAKDNRAKTARRRADYTS